jgi:hypothetical protein
MPSLKIDIIVDDKGRPVIDKTSASMRDLARSTEHADTALRKKTGTASQSESSMAGLTRSILRLYAAYYVVSQGIQGMTSLLMQGVKAIDDYNLSIAKMAAMMTGMMVPNGKSLAEQYQEARAYAEQLNVMIEQVDKNTLLTATDLRQITEEMLKQGVVVDTNSQKQVEAFTSISNALAVIAQGAPNKEIQLRQEIRALLTGQMRDTDQLSKMLNAQTGDLKEQLKIHKEQGDLIEWLGEQLRGFAAAQGDINASWEATKTTLETIYEQILRAGFQTAFRDINSSVRALSEWATQHKAQIAEMLERGYAYIKIAWYDIKNFAINVYNVLEGYKPLLTTIIGLTGALADKFGGVQAALIPISKLLGTILAGYLELVTAVVRFNPAAVAGRILAGESFGDIWKDAKDTVGRGKNLVKNLNEPKVGDIGKSMDARRQYIDEIMGNLLGSSYDIAGWGGAGKPNLKIPPGDGKGGKDKLDQQVEAMNSWLEKAKQLNPFLDEQAKKEADLAAEAEKLTRKWGEQAWIAEGLKIALNNLELSRIIKEYEELGKKVQKFASDEELAAKAAMDFGYEQAKALEDIYYNATKNLQNFDDEFATATANAQNELDALLTKEKSFIKDSKSEFDQLKDVIDGWGKDSADAIAKFCTGAETDFGDMIQSMIQDLMKMMIYQNITGPLFSQISGGSFLSGLFGGGGASMGHGDWTAGLGFHGGGVPAYDSPAFTRTVPGAVFANAPRFHSGIGPGERAAIIRNDEGVFTPGQMKALGKGKGGNTVIVHLENPVFQDLETQNRTMAQIAEIVAKKVAPGAVVENYKNDGEIRAMVKGRA